MFKTRACRVLGSGDVFRQQTREMFLKLTCGMFIAMCSIFALHPPKDHLEKHHVNKHPVIFFGVLRSGNSAAGIKHFTRVACIGGIMLTYAGGGHVV